MLRISSSVSASNIASKRMSREHKFLQLNLIPPLFNILNEIFDGILRCKLKPEIVIRPATATHANDVNKVYLEPF